MPVSRDIDVIINDESGEFRIQARFPDIAPVTDEMDPARAQKIFGNLNGSISTRLYVFCHILNQVARRGTLDHWKELDVGLTSLVMLLEEKDLDGAIECIKSAFEKSSGVAPVCDSSDS